MDSRNELVCKNNSNVNSKWYCIDIEYVKQRENNQENEGGQFGRFDIIAVSKEKKHRVALIELKYNKYAMGGDSGVVKHVSDYINFIKKKIFEKYMKAEIINIIKSLHLLHNDDTFLKFDVNELANAPEFYFITLDNENNEPRKTMLRYIRKDVKGASKCTVEYQHSIDITKEHNGILTPTFLFSDNKIANIKIDDILQSELYTKGFD